MNTRHDDYLWDPRSAPDQEVERLERLLQPLGTTALGLAARELPLPMRSHRPLVGLAAIAASVLLMIYAAHVHRLHWRESSPWPVMTLRKDGSTQSAQLHVGERIVTGEDETAKLEAARIGNVTVGSNSAVVLTRTRAGQHRIELERGRLHAKIWAPPSFFGVTHGELRFTDLGCEFDLSVDAGSGTLAVASGWVVYRHRDDEVLVPENYALDFNAAGVQVPLRIDALPAYRARVIELDERAGAGTDQVVALARAIVADTRDEDFFTLLNLLIRHPQLADSALYDRLATALGVQADEAHRARWARGDADAREEWWRRLPAQPKTWWLNWQDMF